MSLRTELNLWNDSIYIDKGYFVKCIKFIKNNLYLV